MDEIDEWTVGPIPMRPSPGPAAPSPSPDDGNARAVPPTEPRIPEPSGSERPAAPGNPPFRGPTLKGLSHAGVPEAPAMPPSPSRPPRRNTVPAAIPEPAPVRPEPSLSAPGPENVRDDLEAVADIPPEPHGIPHAAVIVCCSVAGLVLASALAGGCVVAAGRGREGKAVEQARERCESSLEQLSSARRELDKAMDEAERASKTDPKTVKDPKTIDGLNRATSVRTPATVSCDASDADGLDAATAKAGKATKAANASAKAIRTAIDEIEASKLDKTVDDASRLLKDSDGKVQDAKTRDALAKAIKARDAAAIAKAVKSVNDSKAAKEKADAEAKAKADEEAAKRKAEEEAAEQQQPQNVQRQATGTGQSRIQRQESVQTPSAPQRRPSSTPSAPSWNVPSETDDEGMPNTDPGL